MAHYEDVAALQEMIVVAESADISASGTAASFSHPIRAIQVDDPQQYKIALVEATFTHPGGTPVYISTNLVGFTRVGSQMTNTVYRVPDMPAGEQHIVQQAAIVQWRPYAAFTNANLIECVLTDSAGALIAAAGTTSLTFAIRRI